MSLVNIHYMPATGRITAIDNGHREDGNEQSYRDDSVAVTLDVPHGVSGVNARAQRIDPATRCLVGKTADEIAAELRPTLQDINTAIYNELLTTDAYVDPPSDRPRKGPFAHDWKPYRQALRDLSKLDTVEEMIASWPRRPDGSHNAFEIHRRLRQR